MPQLIVIAGTDRGKRFTLKDLTVGIGRHSSNPIHLDDNRVSRHHLELRASPNGYTLADLGSGNGTLLNDKPVQQAELRPGDRIAIGDTVLLFTTDGSTGTASVNLAEPGSSRISGVVRSIPADAGSVLLKDPTQANTAWLRTRLSNLAVLYEAATAVSDILDVDELLEKIMSLVLRTTEADQGCFLLKDAESGALLPKAVRARIPGTADLAVSRTIVDHVLKEQAGILIANAAEDDRFRAGPSVARHRLREVICVPMRGRHETVGVLFLDTQTGVDDARFTDDHLQLAIAIAHQAGLAVEETRYYGAMLHAERLAAVGQTIAGMSHHIKNIMQGVRFGSDMVRTALKDDDRELLAKGWRLVEKNQARIDDLILDMLSYSKERDPIIETTDLVELVQDVLELVRGRAAEAKVALAFAPPADFPKVPCDADGVHRALLNLVGNAIDALDGRANGTVSLELRLVGDRVELDVRDNGPGIPADQHEEIFKPFISSKGNRGTGLGLPVSRKAIEEQGGELLLASEEDRGTCFTIRLPLKRPATAS
ncbi:MAG: FHA domain-containing protein [Gemmataceae bacterium]|nr:FHA domain-containing protein [Gemmataceae bacterium]